MRIIFASNNPHKLMEVKEILGEKYKDFIFSLNEIGVAANPEETGSNYEENADIKAKATYDALIKSSKIENQDIILADDTGLSIDFLDGAPGIKSARFMGDGTSQEEKNIAILKLMENVEDSKRTAYFSTVLSVIDISFDKSKILHFTGRVDGYIARKIEESIGFGYDPIFAVGDPKDISCGIVKTYSNLGKSGKNAVSHRALALSKFIEYLEKYHNI